MVNKGLAGKPANPFLERKSMIHLISNLIGKLVGLFRAEEAKITALVGGNVTGAVAQGVAHATKTPAESVESWLRIVLLLVQIVIGVATAIYVIKRVKSPKKPGKDLFLVIGMMIILGASGCVTAQKGGSSGFRTPSGLSGGVKQSENPKSDTTQNLSRITREFLPDGKVIVTEEKLDTKIGSAQKDTAREMGAKLASLKGVVWVGIALFVFGAASLVWPPLKAIVGSTTTSLVASAAGIALIMLPSLIVGHELLILCIGVGAVLAYWFAHRHGELRGQLKSK
jgi:hypothetical protein